MTPTACKIGEAAKATGLSVDAIRFYEKSGLLNRPSRTEGGYRVYGSAAIADLEFIQRAQRLGFSLQEIRELFSIRRSAGENCAHVRKIIAQKLETVRSKIAELKHLESELASAEKQCEGTLRSARVSRDRCPVLESITKGGHS